MTSYGRDIVTLALDEIGLEVTDRESDGWAMAICPLHSSSSLNFGINMDEGMWVCFSGCGRNGDLAVLIAAVTGENLKDVRRRLRATLINDPDALAKILTYRDKSELTDSLGESLFYHRGKIHKYLTEQRGFDKKTLLDWGIGWDVETNQIVIPIYFNNKLRGLIRRFPTEIYEGQKYDYTYGFDREATIFGFDKAKSNPDRVIIVEGALDCIWLHQHGYNSVAILGASISKKQAELLKKSFQEIVFAFDNDSAGKIATEQAIFTFKGITTYVTLFPNERKDVQQCSAEELKNMFIKPRETWYNLITGTLTVENKINKKGYRENDKHSKRSQ